MKSTHSYDNLDCCNTLPQHIANRDRFLKLVQHVFFQNTTSAASFSPVVLARLRSQSAVDSAADGRLSSVPWLLHERPSCDVVERSTDGVVGNERQVSTELSTNHARMKRVGRHFCACQHYTPPTIGPVSK